MSKHADAKSHTKDNNHHKRPRRVMRVVAQNGRRRSMKGLWFSSRPLSDLYHLFLRASWTKAILGAAGLYVLVNLIFATAFFLAGDCIANAKPHSFMDVFFFSVQTLVTLGYGQMFPKTMVANVLVTLEVFVGLIGFAFLTGLLFAKFSRPTAKVIFSKYSVVSDRNGEKALSFRIANERANEIVAAQVSVTVLKNEVTQEGEKYRRLYDLELIRKETPVFALTWTLIHPISSKSPIYGLTQKDLQEMDSEIIVSFSGQDETFMQSIFTRHSYVPEEIVWDHRLVDILRIDEFGEPFVDYERFHDIQPVEIRSL